MKDVRKVWENCGLSDSHITEERHLVEGKCEEAGKTVGRRNTEREGNKEKNSIGKDLG